MKTCVAVLALAAPAMAFVPSAPLQRSSVRMSAESERKTGLPVGNLMKGFATASMFFNFVAMPFGAPDAAMAKAGDGPKQSVFGIGGDAASSPFTVDTPTYSPYSPYGTGKDALFKPLSDDDVKMYTGKVKESKKRVDKIGGYLEKKQWEEVRSELTRQVYDLRRSGEKLAQAKGSAAAKDSLKALFQDIEDLTVTSRRKQLPEAQEAYTKAKADFEAFLKAI